MVSSMPGTPHIPPCIQSWAKELGFKWSQMFSPAQKCYAFGTEYKVTDKSDLVTHTANIFVLNVKM